MTTLFRGRTAVAVCVTTLIGLALVLPATAEDDEPTPGRRWILEMKHGPLKTVLVERSGGRADAYHYMTFEVRNGTDFPRPWNPLVKAITDTPDPKGGQRTYVAGGWSDALEKIRRRERNAALVPLNETAGRLQPGQSVQAVAIFGVLDSLYDTIRLEVHGLADAVATYKVENYDGSEVADGEEITPDNAWVIVDSAYWDRNQAILDRLRAAGDSDSLPVPTTDYVVMSERRYWEMVYERLGDEFRAEDDLITFVGERWALEGNPKKLRSVTKKDS